MVLFAESQGEMEIDSYAALKDFNDEDLKLFERLEKTGGNGFVWAKQIQGDNSPELSIYGIDKLLNLGTGIGLLQSKEVISLGEDDLVDGRKVYVSDAKAALNKAKVVYRMNPEKRDAFKSTIIRLSAERASNKTGGYL